MSKLTELCVSMLCECAGKLWESCVCERELCVSK